jgi:hypothetical protein
LDPTTIRSCERYRSRRASALVVRIEPVPGRCLDPWPSCAPRRRAPRGRAARRPERLRCAGPEDLESSVLEGDSMMVLR